MSLKGSRRSYGDACGISRALDVVGDRWALVVVRELLLGPKRFTDVRAGLPGLSADVLSQRLRELEESGVVSRRTLPPPAAAKVYELTPAGRALEPVLIELGRWGGANAHPPEPGSSMSLDSHLVSMRTLFDPARAEGLEALVALNLGTESFTARIGAGRVEVARGDAPEADASIATDPTTLIDVLHGRRDFADAVSSGDLEVGGDEAVIARFIRLFPLPEPASA